MGGQSEYDDDAEESSKELVERPEPKIPGLFKALGLGSVTTKDTLTVSYKAGTLKATVKRPDGVAQTVHRNVGSGFRSMTEFDPSTMRSKEERNRHIQQKYAQGATQQDLAEQFGLSQSMVGRIVNSK